MNDELKVPQSMRQNLTGSSVDPVQRVECVPNASECSPKFCRVYKFMSSILLNVCRFSTQYLSPGFQIVKTIIP